MDGQEVVTFGLRRRKSRRSDLVELDEALGFVAAGRPEDSTKAFGLRRRESRLWRDSRYSALVPFSLSLT